MLYLASTLMLYDTIPRGPKTSTCTYKTSSAMVRNIQVQCCLESSDVAELLNHE